MKRRILWTAAGLFVLLAVAMGAAMTSTAVARWLAARLEQAVPGLTLQVRAGSLWSGLDIRSFAYRSDGTALAADRVDVRWSWECLAAGNFCLDRIHAEGLQVTVRDTGAPAAQGGEASGAILPPLPVDVLFRDVRVDGLVVATPSARVRVKAIRLRGALERSGLRLTQAALTNPVVELPADGGGNGGGSGKGAPIELPTLAAPIPVRVAGLRLVSPKVEFGGAGYEAKSVELGAVWQGERLRIDRLAVDHARGRLQASGTITLQGGYPLSLQLRGELIDAYRGQPASGSVTLSNSVRQLDLRGQVSGPAAVRFQGQLKPLQPTLPYRLTLQSDRLAWPPAGDGKAVTVDGVDLSVQGDLSGYRLSGSGRLRGTAVPQLTWRLDASGDWRGARLEALALTGLNGTARVNGRVSWAPAVSWQGDLTADGVDLGAFWDQAPNAVTGRAHVTGAVADTGWRLSVNTPGLSGTWQEQPVTLEGSVRRQPEGRWHSDRLTLSNGGNRLIARGGVGSGLDISADLQLKEPGRWLSGAEGNLQGTLHVKGSMAQPSVDADLGGSQLKLDGATVAQATLTARVRALATETSSVRLLVHDAVVEERHIDNALVEVSGTRAEHHLLLRISGDDAAVELRAKGNVDTHQVWHGRIVDGLVAWQEQRWRLREPVPVSFDAASLEARLGAHCWVYEQASVCVTEPARLGPRGSVALRLDALPLGWLDTWLPAGLTWAGTLSGTAQAAWGPDNPPQLQADLVSEGGRLVVSGGDDASDVPLRYERLAVTASLDARTLHVETHLGSEAVGNVDLRLQVAHARAGRPISGRLQVQRLRLDVLQPFFPRIKTLRGHLEIAGDIGGSLTQPTFDGRVQLLEGELAGPELPVTLKKVELTAEVSGQRASLDGSFASGDGHGRISGTGQWRNGQWSVQASLTGQKLEVRYPPIAALRVSPDLRLQASPGNVSVSGRIEVPEGQLTLKQLPKGAVPYSSDVVVVRGPGAKQGNGEESSGLAIQTDIEVVLGDEVRFSGLGATGRLTGALRIRQVAATTAEASGEIRIVDAEFEAYGQKLDIRRGRLIFAGPVTEPQVEIEAVRKVQDVVVGLRVSGRASQPNVTLFSEPPMPEEQILAYLVTGRAYGEAGPEENAAMAQAAVALGVFTSRGTASKVAKTLGVEDFALSTEGEGQSTQVAVSGYIAPNLLVKYGVGVFSPLNTLTLRYNVTKNIYLEAVSGLESAIDAFYTFSF